MGTKNALVLSLGHNSSAILVSDDRIVAGYETERLTGKKSDSIFPELPIRELQRRFELVGPTDLYVSHWELFGEIDRNMPKHWDPKVIREVSAGGHVFSVNPAFTHHDAHAWSAVAFVGDEFPRSPSDSAYVFVMDGFGTFGEHMSFYRYIDGIPVLLERKYGFGSSLGLLYQYTTAFIGMKQNQDEYKLLAFEAHIDEYAKFRKKIDEQVVSWSEYYMKAVSAYMEPDKTDPMLNVGALPNTAENVAGMLSSVIKSLGTTLDERGRRIVCSYFTQRIVEEVVTYFVDKYQPKNLILVGGLFYNVKINNLVTSKVPGLTSIMPLAGDQGAGLGVYKAINPSFEWPGHLFWGPRDLDRKSYEGANEMGLLYFDDEDEAFEEIDEQLRTNFLVNVVRGPMEFGPRALCNTSTLARPDLTTAATINHLNNRTNEMPFAPVMTADQATIYLENCDKVHKSLDYMICTRDFRKGTHLDLPGASHKYPDGDRYSARPQITEDPRITELLDRYGPLINTSFNYHGVPIVCTDEQIRHSHAMELARSETQGVPTTVVIGGKKK